MKVRAWMIHPPAEPHLVPDIQVELVDDDGDSLLIPDIFLHSMPSRSLSENVRSFQEIEFNNQLYRKLGEAVFSAYGEWQWDLWQSKREGKA
jgi:hypothetical protein